VTSARDDAKIDAGGDLALVVRVRDTTQIRSIAPLVVEDSPTDGMPKVRLLESEEYRYEWRGLPEGVRTEPAEMFNADNVADGRAGRLRTGLNTGTVVFKAAFGETVARGSFEVRSRKMDYLNHYQQMLADVTKAFVEAAMLRFSPASHSFQVDSSAPARMLYQRFVFLQHALLDGGLSEAFDHIIRQPHVRWRSEPTSASPARGIRPSSTLAASIARPGARIGWDDGGGVDTLPREMQTTLEEATVDNIENRFVAFALDEWIAIAQRLHDALEAEQATSMVVQRGLFETDQMIRRLEVVRNSYPFIDVGHLARMPEANQVLQRKSGYREIYRAFVQADLAAQLTWEGGEDVYGAGKRNIAALYEYWVFLEIARLVGGYCRKPFDIHSLIRDDEIRGPYIEWRSGDAASLTAVADRRGVVLELELYYNRTFPADDEGAWSRPMRPDCSLRVTAARTYDLAIPPTWIHFDAKYRVEVLQELLGGKDVAAQKAELCDERERGISKRSDLLKMHAYRDAIRNSSAAYVIYPGDQNERLQTYPEEVLPGLGAFRLCPRKNDEPIGSADLKMFIEEVLDHLASRVTRHERARYWERAIWHVGKADPNTESTERPAADTWVVIGYVKSARHWAWIHANRLYALRRDDRPGAVGLGSRELSADLALLYDADSARVELWRTSGSVDPMTNEDLEAIAYPTPGGRRYFCLGLAQHIGDADPLTLRNGLAHAVARSPRGVYAPFVETLAALIPDTTR
jgi:predicted component of viral defense system (DUF524 family)